MPSTASAAGSWTTNAISTHPSARAPTSAWPGDTAPAWITGGRNTLAIRISAHPVVVQLCEALGHALVSTSANPTGIKPALNALQLHRYFDAMVDAILVSQLSTYISFAVLANMIRHAILDDLGLADFRIMVVVGVGLFYLGKQTAYYINRPEYRIPIWLNTISMFIIVGFSLLLPEPQYILFGAAFSKMVYIAMNYRTQIKLYGHAHL